MNPLKKQNSFEQQLQESLNGMEFKPSDALWDKIAQNMGADSFEPQLQNKLQDFIVDPNIETWEQLETQLPEKKKRFGWLWLSSILIVGAIAGSLGLYLSNQKTASTALVQTKTVEFNTDNKSSSSNTNAKSNIISKKTQNKPSQNKSVDTVIKNILPTSPSSSLASKNKSSKAAIGLNQTENSSKDKSKTAEAKLFKNSKKTKQLAISVASNDAFNNSISNSNPIETQVKAANQIPAQLPSVAAPAENQSIGREIVSEKTATPLKSLLDSQLAVPIAKSNVYIESDLDLSKLSIVANIGIHLSFMKLISPTKSTQNLDKALALRKEIEVPEFDFSANLSGEYAITEKFYVRLGIGILSFSQDVKYNLTNADSVPQRGYSENFYLHNSDSIIVGAAYTTKNKYSFTEIPIWIGYKIVRGRLLGFDLNLGASYGKLNLVNAYLPDQSCDGLMVVSDKASFPTYKNMWFLNIAPAVTWQMNTMLDIGLMPQLRVGMNNMVSPKDWIGQRPWSTGLNLFLRKRF